MEATGQDNRTQGDKISWFYDVRFAQEYSYGVYAWLRRPEYTFKKCQKLHYHYMWILDTGVCGFRSTGRAGKQYGFRPRVISKTTAFRWIVKGACREAVMETW